MKKLNSILLKGLLSIVLFTGVTVTLSVTGVKTVNEAQAAVSEQEVRYYLEQNGYIVHKLRTVQGSENWEALTTKNNINYKTTVFVEGTQIIGNEDVAL